jgi:hypothetical protein
MAFENLLSKVTAAGLAAGVFLLWWPAHLPSAGAQWLVLRGLAWTLAFELLVLAFTPLERMAAGTLARRGAAAGARRVRSALAGAPSSARKGGAVALAVTGLLVPALMLSHARRPPSKPAARPATVVRKVIVRRQVVRRETVIVRAAPAPAPIYASTAPPQRSDSAKPAAHTAREPEPKPDPVVDPARPEQAAPKQTTVPADSVAAPQPSDTAAAPAQDATADPAAGLVH